MVVCRANHRPDAVRIVNRVPFVPLSVISLQTSHDMRVDSLVRFKQTKTQMRLTAAFSALLLTLIPAEAGLQVCNKANVATEVALGRFDGKAWGSEGWWTIPPQRCLTLIQGPLDARYYYLYGTDGGSGTWGGDTGFCTASGRAFKITGRGGCAARGYDRKGFFEIDTKDKTNVTQSLSN
jgi:uncharacterized membrane protein